MRTKESRRASDIKYREVHKPAILERNRKYYRKNQAKHYKSTRQWRAKNPDKVKNYNRKYAQTHKDKINAWSRKWRSRNKAKYKQLARKYQTKRYSNHREEILASNALWKGQNREHLTRYRRKRKIERWSIDPEYRIREGLRHRIYLAVKRKRPRRTMELLGCSWAQFKLHLQSLFKPGMTWANYGYRGWHIDHKRPCASFNLTDPKEQSECFHYSNLQPLWMSDNFKKSAKLR